MYLANFFVPSLKKNMKKSFRLQKFSKNELEISFLSIFHKFYWPIATFYSTKKLTSINFTKFGMERFMLNSQKLCNAQVSSGWITLQMHTASFIKNFEGILLTILLIILWNTLKTLPSSSCCIRVFFSHVSGYVTINRTFFKHFEGSIFVCIWIFIRLCVKSTKVTSLMTKLCS